MAKRTNDGLGALPVWDLGDLFAGRDSAELEAALAAAASTAADFGKRHKGRLKGLSGRALGAAVAEYEAIEEATARVLASSASAGIKAIYTRALAPWLPLQAQPPPAGVRLTWDDDEF